MHESVVKFDRYSIRTVGYMKNLTIYIFSDKQFNLYADDAMLKALPQLYPLSFAHASVFAMLCVHLVYETWGGAKRVVRSFWE